MLCAGIAAIAPAQAAKAVHGAPASAQLCVGGARYRTTLDDEFAQDSALNSTSSRILATPAPSGAMWSTTYMWGRTSNKGTDDAYYTDSAQGFGRYTPFSLSGGALNITAEPVPQPYATASPLSVDGVRRHWLSGVLVGPAQTYGYVEVSAKEPNRQGFWPAALWLWGLHGSDGHDNGYEELDANEIMGSTNPRSSVQQTQHFSLSHQPPPRIVKTVVRPDPDTAYHTYGVWWTPSIVQFFIDRKPTSAQFPNAANGPANPIIILQVFAPNAWSPPPASASPQTLSLRYFRWYQSTGASCSPSDIGGDGTASARMPSAAASSTP